MTYTPEQKRRIEQALAETKRFIEREGERDPSLRPADMQQHLEFCIGHKVKLEAMLKT